MSEGEQEESRDGVGGAVFQAIARFHPTDHDCHPTGRYKGGHDLAGGYESSVLMEERTCGAWLLVISESTDDSARQS